MNIFARELVLILDGHGKQLSNLYGLRLPDPYRPGQTIQIAPNKVTRLIRSLTEDITATLNAEELDALKGWAGLSDEEMRRLRAAAKARKAQAAKDATVSAVAFGEGAPYAHPIYWASAIVYGA